MEEPTIGSLLTIGGNAIVVGIAVELIKRTLALTPELQDRFGPLLSVGLGIATAIGAAFLTGGDIASASLTGFMAGAVASGVYSLKAVRA